MSWRWRFWRRRRARIALGGARVIDMSSVIHELDSDVSQFTTMLTTVARAQAEGASIQDWSDPRIWDDWGWTSEWEQRRDEALRYFEKQMRPSPIISWMEDEFMPRVGRVLRGDDKHLLPGDIVRVVAAGQ